MTLIRLSEPIFTNDAAEIQAEGAPLPALKIKGLKEFIRQNAKPLSSVEINNHIVDRGNHDDSIANTT